MSAIHINNVGKRFGDTVALSGVDLSVRDGELFSLLGPSGCGKTTLLNIIAGFLDPSHGTILVDDRDITGLAPYRRDIGMVFQNYALFPHLNVFDNVAYGLRVRKLSQADVRSRVDDALQLVRLQEHAQRMPHQLSGGQQQRVAIARALAIRPKVLLLDEPLSNLDAKLRTEMQSELRRMQRSVGITTVLVTHDQEEALSLSDRIGILGGGILQQVGTPAELYRHPANQFVAAFIGQANLLQVRPAGDEQTFEATDHFTNAKGSADHPETDHSGASRSNATSRPLLLRTAAPAPGARVLMLRPERVRIGASNVTSSDPNQARARLLHTHYTGASSRLTLELEGGGELIAEVAETAFPTQPAPGTLLDLSWDAGDLVPLPETQAPRALEQTP
jgi:putative spermidine/putrescine transport system ATP-binding protein